MGFIETSYGSKPNLSDVNIDSNLNLGIYGITTDGELNLNDSDLIGVRRFTCEDYLGAIIATASNAEKKAITINVSGNAYSEKIRIPSNFVTGSVFRVVATVSGISNTTTAVYPPFGTVYYNSNNQPVTFTDTTNTVYVSKYDPVSETYSNLGNILQNGTVISGNKRYLDVSGIKGGDYLVIHTINQSFSHTVAANTTYCIYNGVHFPITNAKTYTNSSASAASGSFSVCCDVANYTSAGSIWD